MAPARASPYSAFGFLVAFEPGTDVEPWGGFSEVTGLGTEVTVVEYRNGDEALNPVRKLPSAHKYTDVTLKRGVVVDARHLHDWMDTVRTGAAGAQRDVFVQLRAAEGGGPVATWKLSSATPVKCTGPHFAATGSDVAIEELVLAAERIELV